MTEGSFPKSDGDNAYASEYNKFLYSKFVETGCGLVANYGNLNIGVCSGIAWVNGTRVSVANTGKTISAADATNPRYDVVTLNSSGTITVTEGTPAASPAIPTYPVDELLLGLVYVPVGTTALTAVLNIQNVETKHDFNGLLFSCKFDLVSGSEVNSAYNPTAYSLTEQGTVTKTATPAFSTRCAGTFTDANYYTFSDNSILKGRTQGSIDCWIYLTDNTPAENQYIIDGTSTNHMNTWFVDTSGFMNFRLDQDSALVCSAPYNLLLNTWVHVAVSWGPGGKKIFINNQLVAQDQTTTAWTNENNTISIANYFSTTVGAGNLVLDNLRIWSVQKGWFDVENYI